MLASVTRYFTAPVTSRAYNTVSGAFRARLTRGTTRAADHNTGRGTAAFNEREAALENKAVKDQEFLNLQRSKEDAKVRTQLNWSEFRCLSPHKHTFTCPALANLPSALSYYFCDSLVPLLLDSTHRKPLMLPSRPLELPVTLV